LDPRLIGIEYELPLQAGGSKNATGQHVGLMFPGWYAISVNYLHGFAWGIPQDALIGFQKLRPVAMAGYSIYIYHVTLDEANRVRRELGLPELTGG
jgi:hypothetical protein